MKQNLYTAIFGNSLLKYGLTIGLLAMYGGAFAQPSSSITIGTGTSDNGIVPINSCYGYSYTQQIYTHADIVAANGGNPTATNTITAIRFYVTELPWDGVTSDSEDWVVYLGTTTDATFSSSTDWVPLSELTEVFNGTATFPAAADNWMEFVFDAPFEWDGTSNLVVAVEENTPAYDCTVYFQSHTASGKSLYFYDDSENPDPASPPSGTTYGTRAHIQLDFVVPPDNIGVDSIYTPQAVFCSGEQPVMARIHNYGSSIVNSFNVHWSVNGVQQAVVAITGATLDMENTTAGPYSAVQLGVMDFPYDQNMVIEAWTSMPNNTADTKTDNDSLSAEITATLEGFQTQISPQDTIMCQGGGSLNLDAGSAPKNPIYIWSTGMLTQTMEITEGGSYYVKVQNTDGCIGRDTVFIDEIAQPVANSIAIIDNGGGTFTFNVIGAQNATTYIWDFGDGTTATGAGPQTHFYEEEGLYTATLTLSNECGSIELTRVIAVGPTAIGALAALEAALNIYPNPASSYVMITNESTATMEQVSIYNLLGQQVYQQVVSGNELRVNTGSFASGIYNVMIQTDLGTITRKLELIR